MFLRVSCNRMRTHTATVLLIKIPVGLFQNRDAYTRTNFKPMDFDMDCLETAFKYRTDNLKDIDTIMKFHSNSVFKIMPLYKFFIFLTMTSYGQDMILNQNQ